MTRQAAEALRDPANDDHVKFHLPVLRRPRLSPKAPGGYPV